MSTPTRSTVLTLYRNFLETGSRFVDYNFREYTLRKVRHEFQQNKSINDYNKLNELYQYGIEQYKSLQRQVLINSLYAHGDYVIEKTANVHKHAHSTTISKNNTLLHATPRTNTTALDDRTTMENRMTPDHYASKTTTEPATAIPS